MKTRHPHSDAIERVGYEALMAHFMISRQALHKWKVNGIPERHQKTFKMLAAIGGHETPEVEIEQRTNA